MRDLFEQLRVGGEVAVEELVKDGTHETVELEFKTKTDPSHGRHHNDDRKNLAKELSAFSNSMGGLLVWGVVAEKDAEGIDRAVATARIAEIDRFAADTLTLIGELLVPKNDDIHVEALHATDGSGTGYLLVYVGRSARRPHRSEARNQKQYFKRSGDSAYQMEHFDIEDAFSRVSPPDLSIYWELQRPELIREAWKWRVLLHLANDSRTSARFPYINVCNLSGCDIAPYSIAGRLIHGLKQKAVGGWTTFRGGADDVVHPGQKLLMTAIGFNLVTRENNEWHRIHQGPITFEYQYGALDCRMCEGLMTIEGGELDVALIQQGVDIVND